MAGILIYDKINMKTNFERHISLYIFYMYAYQLLNMYLKTLLYLKNIISNIFINKARK